MRFKFIILAFMLCATLVFSAASDVPVDCTQIFEARKSELVKELEKIDEQRQVLEAYRAQVQSAYDKSLADLNSKKAEIEATQKRVEAQKAEIAAIKEQNEKILADLKSMTSDKVAASYAKMKDQAAADVLSAMSGAAAASILYALEPKKIAAVMAKMSPDKASTLTKMLQDGPPFKDEKKEEISSPAGSLIE
ncbi:MotE family protein [Campylobacter sp. 19-13652]|uniref:MotE family protein n=1 Tax=Campylobacter sp. 19-13652 TaxID=2840180 RepID=UPI001C75331F|nr:5'-nucleosidase [Campylobacter sp. 19-13652]BCX80102.1 hypothetical protein LBC_15640 [Campylobacter sp. 19-13652]